MKLLNIDANPKTVKGQAHGYMTAILYLAPWKLSGVNVCPTAELAGCRRSCLNTAGRAGISADTFRVGGNTLPDNAIQRARIARTRFFHEHRAAFIEQLCTEIAAFVRTAERKGFKPCVRLNGTSDLPWENLGGEPLKAYPHGYGRGLPDLFPTVQFYDYTKLPSRLLGSRLPANYHLSISWSGHNRDYQTRAEYLARQTGAPLVVVDSEGFRKDGSIDEMVWHRLFQIKARADCKEIVNGDEHDLRFLHEPHTLVVLRAKGAARKESNGFVLEI